MSCPAPPAGPRRPPRGSAICAGPGQKDALVSAVIQTYGDAYDTVSAAEPGAGQPPLLTGPMKVPGWVASSWRTSATPGDQDSVKWVVSSGGVTSS
jgi:hypothetical protein